MRVSPIQQSFNAGEISRRMLARTDFPKYGFAGEVVENFVMLPQGGMTRRPGTQFVAPTKGNGQCRLMSFVFSDVQAYILEFGAGYIRFFKDKGQIVSSGSPYEIASPYTLAELDELHVAQSADVLYIAHPSHPPRKLSRTGHTAWTLSVIDFHDGPYIENTTTTTLTASGIEGTVTVSASAAAGINNGAGFKATDVGRSIRIHEGWAKIATVVNALQVTATVQEKDGFALLLPKYTATTISFKEGDPDATGQAHNDSILDSNGKFAEYNFKVDQKFAVSGSASNNGTVRAVYVDSGQIKTAIANDVTDEAAGASVTLAGVPEATTDWGLGAWSSTTGWPAAVGFHEERLFWGGTSEQPQTFWGSRSGDFENHGPGSNDGDALSYTIASGQVNVIRWLASADKLLVGTAGAEFTVDSDGPVLTPTDVRVRRATTHGSSNIPPIQVGNVVVFPQRTTRKLREFVYNFDVAGYVAPDLTILSEHITQSGLVGMAYQEEPDSVLWCVRGDGRVATCTYRRDQDVTGWARQLPGGAFSGGAAVVESVAAIPGTGDTDEVWFVVKRTINGETKRYVEVLADPFVGPVRDDYATDTAWRAAIREAQKEAFYVDCGLTYRGAPADTISGLEHLEGETVSVLADGYVHNNLPVTGGAITLDREASIVHVGLPYVHRFKGTKPVAQSQSGTAVGKIKKFSKVTLVTMDSGECYVGTSWDKMVPVENRIVGDPMDNAVPLSTGERSVALNGSYEADTRLHLKGDQPLPFTLLALAPVLTVNEL